MIDRRTKQLRTEKKMTQLELATILNVSDRTVSKWEQLKGNPDLDILPKLADALCVSCDYLLTGKESDYHLNNARSLYDFVNSRIEPYSLREEDTTIFESLVQEHDYDFLCSCFLIAHGQIVSKGIQGEEFIPSLLTQFQRIVYVKSRPPLVQKMGELYYTYRKKPQANYLSKESFTKKMYYYLSKAGLGNDNEKVKYIEDTLMPLVMSSKNEVELRDNLRLLLKKKSPFDSNNTLEEDPVVILTPLEQKIKMMEMLKAEEYMAILQNGAPVAASDKKIIKRLRSDYRLPESVISVVLDYCLMKDKNVLVSWYVDKVAASVVREGVENAEETISYFKRINQKDKKK